MTQTKEIIVQEFFGKLFNTVNEFADGIFATEIEDKQILNSDEAQETLYKTKQNLINLTKDNIVKSVSKEEFSKNTKKSFNGFNINFPEKAKTLLEVCNKNEALLTKYLLIFEIPEENFKDIKDETKRLYLITCAYNWGPQRILSAIDKGRLSMRSPSSEVFSKLQKITPTETQGYLLKVTQYAVEFKTMGFTP